MRHPLATLLLAFGSLTLVKAVPVLPDKDIHERQTQGETGDGKTVTIDPIGAKGDSYKVCGDTVDVVSLLDPTAREKCDGSRATTEN